MDELPNDMFQEIYKYLTQSEIVNMLMLNKRIYEQTMRYIDSIYIYNKSSNYTLVGNIKRIQTNKYKTNIDEINKQYYNNHNLLYYFISNNYIIYIIDYFTKCDTIIYYNFINSYKLRINRKEDIKICIKYAAEYGYINIIKFFINRYDIRLDYALNDACMGNHIDIVNLILNRGEGYLSSSLFIACVKEKIDLIDLLIKHGAYISNTLLYNICLHGHDIIFKHLVKQINSINPHRIINISKYETLLKEHRQLRKK